MQVKSKLCFYYTVKGSSEQFGTDRSFVYHCAKAALANVPTVVRGQRGLVVNLHEWLVTFFTVCPTFMSQEFCQGNCVIQVWHADVSAVLRLGNTIRQSMPESRMGVKSPKCTTQPSTHCSKLHTPFDASITESTFGMPEI